MRLYTKGVTPSRGRIVTFEPTDSYDESSNVNHITILPKTSLVIDFTTDVSFRIVRFGKFDNFQDPRACRLQIVMCMGNPIDQNAPFSIGYLTFPSGDTQNHAFIQVDGSHVTNGVYFASKLSFLEIQAADKSAADKSAADEAAAGKAAAEKAAADKAAAGKAAAEKAATEKAAVDKEVAYKVAADKEAADKEAAASPVFRLPDLPTGLTVDVTTGILSDQCGRLGVLSHDKKAWTSNYKHPPTCNTYGTTYSGVVVEPAFVGNFNLVIEYTNDYTVVSMVCNPSASASDFSFSLHPDYYFTTETFQRIR